MGPCLVFESDKRVLGDIRTSLNLIDLPLLAVDTVEAAEQVLQEQSPSIVLARLRIEQNHYAGVELARVIAESSEYSDIPVIAIYNRGERDSFAGEMELFSGEIELPVEFPAFTKNVQNFLAGSGSRAVSRNTIEPETEPEPSLLTLEERLLLLERVQLLVMQRLQQDEVFQQVDAAELPQIIAEITGEICRGLDVRKVFG